MRPLRTWFRRAARAPVASEGRPDPGPEVVGQLEQLAEPVQVFGFEAQEPGRETVDQSEELAERVDPRFEPGERRVFADPFDAPLEHDKGRVELAPLAFLEDPAEEDPDVSLGPVELPALTLAMDLVHDAPGHQFSQVHADV